MEIDDECEEDDFKQDMDREGKFSAWHIMITVLMMIPETTYNLHKIVPLHRGHAFEVRCEITELESAEWTFQQKKLISQPNVSYSNCSYHNYDYGKLADKTYEEAMEFIKGKPRPKTMDCINLIYSEDTGFASIYKEFKLFCMKNMEILVIISPLFGSLVGYIFIVPLADIFGRKPVLVLGLNGLSISMLGTNFVSTIDLFIVARLISGIWYAVTKAMTEALGLANKIMIKTMITDNQLAAMELSQPCFRTYQFFVIYIGSSGIVFLCAPILPQFFNHWRVLQWICSIGILLFPVVKWYVPESPRWLFSKNHKGKAWTIVKTLKNAENQNHALLLFNNEGINFWQQFIQHSWEFDDVGSHHFWLTLVLIGITGCSYTKHFAYSYEAIFLDAKKRYLFYFHGGTEWVCLCTCMFLSNVIGRRISIFIVHVCVSLLFFVLIQFKDPAAKIVLFYALETTTGTSFALSKLHGVENVPSSHRCTAIGIFGTAISLMTILLYILLVNLKVEIFFLLMGLTSAAAFGITLFSYNDNRGDLFDTYKEKKTRQLYK